MNKNADVIDVMVEPSSNGIALTWAAYVLNIVGFGLIALILCYVARSSDGVRGTILESHMSWLIRTFWISLGLAILAGLTWVFFIGWIIAVATWIWVVYRVVKGVVRLINSQPV